MPGKIADSENKNQQTMLFSLDNLQTSSTKFQYYLKLATAIMYYGYQGYKFLKKDKVNHYRLQTDVLNIPYKKMVYVYSNAIDTLLLAAENKENELEQIKSLILLYRIPVPSYCVKSFEKGLDALFDYCFDEFGNFKYGEDCKNIRSFFKDYDKKAPQSWHEIARISNWRCKNKKAEPVATKYSAMTTTEHNDQLLSMIEANQLSDLFYLKNMVIKNGSSLAQKIYDVHFKKFIKDEMNEFSVWKRADYDPLWKNRSWQEKQQNIGDQSLNEILMMRDLRVQQLAAWMFQKYDKNSFVVDQVDNPIILDALYDALASDQTIFSDYSGQNMLRKTLIDSMIYVLEHQQEFDQSLIFTDQGILKKYEYHPLILKYNVVYEGDLQKYMNCALLLQADFFDEQTRCLAYYVAECAQKAQSAQDVVTQIVNQKCAEQIFDMISSDDYQLQRITNC